MTTKQAPVRYRRVDASRVIDYEQWSEASKRSYSCYAHPGATREYQDRDFRCHACGCDAVYPAEDQKHDYEVRKLYIHTQRFLCNACYGALNAIRHDLLQAEQRFEHDKLSLSTDAAFITQWLEQLEQFARYRPQQRDSARIAHLRKLLDSLEAAPVSSARSSA